MVNRGVLIFFILVITATSVSAATELYDGWVYHDDTFSAGGDTFTVQFPGGDESFPSRVVLRWKTFTLILNEGDCTEKDSKNVCYIGSDDAVPLDHQFSRWKAHVLVEEYASSITLSRTIVPDDVMPGASFTVTTSFANEGDEEVEDAKFMDSYPIGLFFVTWKKGDCKVIGNTVTWEGPLTIHLTKDCIYTLKTRENGSYSSTATLTYLEGVEQKSLSDTKTITINSIAMHIRSSHIRAVVELDKIITLKFDLFNENPDLYVDVNHFEVKVPNGITIRRRVGFPYREDNRLRYTGRVEQGENISFEIDMEGTFTGDYVLDVSLQYREGIFIREDGFGIPFTVFMDEPSVKTVVDKAWYAPGDTGHFTITVTNPSNEYTIYNIRGEVESSITDLGQPTIMVESLAPGKTVTLKSGTFTVPGDDAPIVSTIWYENDRGQKVTFEKEIIVLVRSAKTMDIEEENATVETVPEQEDLGPGEIVPEQEGSVGEAAQPFFRFFNENMTLILITLFVISVVAFIVVKLLGRDKDSLYEEAAARIKEDLEGKGKKGD